ncbi:MAG: MarR family transcriptional regulator [Treponema sp.]|nr:MarR family transcriptional regulator [Treponema sp.]
MESKIFRTGLLLGAVSNKLKRKFASLKIGDELSSAQGKILHFILTPREKEICQKDIEETFGLRAPSATEILKQLEEKNLIERLPSKEDSRKKIIIPQKSALSYRSQVESDLINLEKQVTNGITSEELKAFHSTLEKIIENLS